MKLVNYQFIFSLFLLSNNFLTLSTSTKTPPNSPSKAAVAAVPPSSPSPKKAESDTPKLEAVKPSPEKQLQEKEQKGFELMKELLSRDTFTRSFKSYAEDIIDCLQHNPCYKELCSTLQELRSCDSVYTLGRKLSPHFEKLPEDVKNTYNNTSYFQLYSRGKAVLSVPV
jgi:hypothetical protein